MMKIIYRSFSVVDSLPSRSFSAIHRTDNQCRIKQHQRICMTLGVIYHFNRQRRKTGRLFHRDISKGTQVEYLERAINLFVLHQYIGMLTFAVLPALNKKLRKAYLKPLREKKPVFIPCRLLSASGYGMFFLLTSSVLYQSIWHRTPPQAACIFITLYLFINAAGNIYVEWWAQNHYVKGTKPDIPYFVKHYEVTIKELLKNHS